MTTINYYLKGSISEKNYLLLERNDKVALNIYLNQPLQIYLKVNMQGVRLQVYTKKRIKPKYWDKSKQLANCKKMKTGCTYLNDWLINLKQEVNENCIKAETSSKRLNKSELVDILNKVSIPNISMKTFNDYLADFLINYKTKSGHPLKSGTKKKYSGLINHLNNFALKYGIQPILSNVDIDFFFSFRKYLQSDLNHMDNTAVKYLKAAKTFFGYLIYNGKMQPIDFSQIKTTETEGEIYTLTIDEILHIQNNDFNNKTLNAVRDIFCFQCWTGQRISDILKINWDAIHIQKNNEKTWNFITVKGEERVSVPIINHADKIISKYINDPLPLPLMSAQKINDHLKTLGLKANLTRMVRKVKYHNGEIEIEHVPLYKVLTSHIARKSYITNSLILDIPERIVRSISKHKNERSFRRYVEISEEYKNQKIREAFNK